MQGLGFVGTAMAVAIASAENSNKKYLFDVYGIELSNTNGLKIINSINSGMLPYKTKDEKLQNNLKKCIKQVFK